MSPARPSRDYGVFHALGLFHVGEALDHARVADDLQDPAPSLPKAQEEAVSGLEAFAARGSRAWLWLSMAAAVVAIAGNIVALTVPLFYGDLTPAFLPQAVAQDVANLVLAAPATLVLAALALHGSLRSYLLWLGVVTFTVYNYVIYAFAIPFGPLFLLWSAVLGLSIYSLIGGVATLRHPFVQSAYRSRRLERVVGLALLVVSAFFAFVWLSEDIPALLASATPASLAALGLPTNPVHILDLAFFLPAAAGAGVMLLRRTPLGNSLAPALLVFLILTGVPILITPFVQARIGGPADWGVALPIGTLTLLLIALLAWLMTTIRADS
jgi:hypothetical protein